MANNHCLECASYISANIGKHGIDVCEVGFSELHFAVHESQEQNTEYLLNHGANVNIACTEGFTPLHLAVNNCNEPIVELLLSHGADIDFSGKKALSPLQFAIEKFIGQYVSHVMSHKGAAKSVEKDEVTAVVPYGAIVKLLLVYGINLNDKPKHRTIASEIYREQNEKILLAHEKEVECMKIEKIVNTEISYHNILTANTNQLASYVMNKNIFQALRLGGYKVKFPIYASMIHRRFERGFQRRQLIVLGCQHFDSFFKSSLRLPENCTEKILTHLNDGQLRMFINSK